LNADVERAVLSCPRLPSLPAVALEILQLCRSPDVDFRRLVAALGKDPAIAARVLRAANTAAVARGQVSTLQKAVMLLGSNTVLSLCLSFSLLKNRRGDQEGGFDHKAFWQRALYSAIGARALAEREGGDGEEAFLGGLLQDLGMLALAAALPAYGPIARAARGNHGRLTDLETEKLGATHAEVGALLGRRWCLPERLQDAVLRSHALPATPPERRGLAEWVQLSGEIADVWVAPSPGNAIAAALDAARALGLDRDVFSSLLARMGVLALDVASDFDVQMGGDEEVQRVLDQANRALARLCPGADAAALAAS